MTDKGVACEWCNGEWNEIAEGDWASLHMEGNTLIAYGEGEARAKCNYCPNCGRRLVDVKGEEK